jgi:hypothetical protein
MVTIRKRRLQDGIRYEIADFSAYVRALEERGIEAPKAQYNVFISFENEEAIRRTISDWEEQVKMFFKLSPATEIECEVVDA